MEKIKKYFGEYNMTWPKVIIFAVITAVYTALINQVDFLYDTSFRDIAIAFEWWFLFAIFIIVNCKKWWEASLKTFVFFLISQPLIYLIEVPFEDLGWGIFGYYKRWAVITVLTLPGAAIAFLLKKKNWLSVAVLSVATGYLGYACVLYLRTAFSDFPRHLLSGIFCVALAVFLIFILLKDKKHRIAALAFLAAVIIAVSIYMGRGNSADIILNNEGSWSYSVEDDSIIKVKLSEDNLLATVSAKHDGGTYLVFENSDGTKVTYFVTVSGGGVWLSPIDSEE